MNRRAFLKTTAATAAAPMFIPASALGRDGHVAPSNRITMGVIGTGNQGTGDMKGFLRDERVQVVAVCDVNKETPGYWDGAIAGREPARIDCTDFRAFRPTGLPGGWPAAACLRR